MRTLELYGTARRGAPNGGACWRLYTVSLRTPLSTRAMTGQAYSQRGGLVSNRHHRGSGPAHLAHHTSQAHRTPDLAVFLAGWRVLPARFSTDQSLPRPCGEKLDSAGSAAAAIWPLGKTYNNTAADSWIPPPRPAATTHTRT